MNVALIGASRGIGSALVDRLIALLVISTITMTASANPLSAYRWNARPLLVFAPEEADTHLQAMRRALAQRRCGLADRDMVIVEVLGQSSGGAGGQPIDARAAAALRREFDVAERAFSVILVGKDGGEKLRASEPPALDEVFTLIDGMPMRRREMRATGAGCER